MNSNESMSAAATKWLDAKGAEMSGRELEEARAYFQDRKDSRRVAKINAVLRKQLIARLTERLTK